MKLLCIKPFMGLGAKEGDILPAEVMDNGILVDGAVLLQQETMDEFFQQVDKDDSENITSDVSVMDFSSALRLLKDGKKLSRSGWNGKGMFIFLVKGSTFKVNRPPLLGIYDDGTEIKYQSHVDMKTADGTIVPWLCSQSDMLANDWGVVE